MPDITFQISDSGYVYGRERDWESARLLGHLASLIIERSPLGEAIRLWWQRYIDSEEIRGRHHE